ncbi:MAG: [CysO sulfur-carrier protein]-S-L-cysteine hydrolase [Chloroflexota bacterium]|nr:[CysO sulfur-carrier protein]-S-L-cysteine hydrolase [Chloroflexota bacterium]
MSGDPQRVPTGLEPGPEADAWRSAAEAGAADRESVRPQPAWSPASASLPAELLAEIVDWSLAGVPNEACGLLAANRTAEDGGTPSRFIPMRNAAESPYRYLIDPDEQLRVMLEIDDRDEVVWGIVHSHVASKAEPSATDVGLAAYPDALYVICSLASAAPDVRAWAIRDGAVGEVVLQRL